MQKNEIVKSLILVPLMCLSVGALTACGKDSSADLVVYSDIYTAEDENNGLADAFAVKDGKYIYVGTKDGAKKYIKEGKTEIIDRTNNGLIMPGCTEGHAHYISGMGQNSQLPGSGQSYEEVLKTLEKRVKEDHITQFISFGWPAASLISKVADGYNFAEEIEKVAPGIPVVLLDDNGHSALCNKTALAKAGVTKENPFIRGGKVAVNADGEVIGYVTDQAVYCVIDRAIDDPLTEEQYRNACVFGMNELLKYGYTNTLDALVNMFDPTGIQAALKKMDDENKLKINIAECFHVKSFDAGIYQSVINEVAEINKKYSSKHCNAGFVKIFADGVVESGSGWIIGEYNDAEEGKEHGNIIWEPSELDAVISYANKSGLTVHTHSYGDGACKAIIDSYIKSNNSNNKQFRNCLAHVRNITDEDIERAAQNKIPVAANLIWHTDLDVDDEEACYIKDLFLDKMGEEYYYSGYPMKSLIDKGVIVTSSSDAPAAMEVEPSILNIIEVATTGLAPDQNQEPFAADELISINDVLKALTINGAWQLGLEKERGSIKVGKYADFLIIDTNFLNYSGDQLRTIHDAKILNTYFEGEKVYSLK